MKTMTCKQMGGPCDTAISGSTPEEMVQNGAAHVTQMQDEEHKKVWQMMMDMQKDPAASQKWNTEFASKFSELPEA